MLSSQQPPRLECKDWRVHPHLAKGQDEAQTGAVNPTGCTAPTRKWTGPEPVASAPSPTRAAASAPLITPRGYKQEGGGARA